MDATSSEKEKPPMESVGSMVNLEKKQSAAAGAAKLPPQDGLRAWGVVLGSFITNFSILGILYSYGIFVTLYQEDLHSSLAAVSSAYTVGLGCFFLVGMVAGRLSDKYGVRQIYSIGIVFCVGALVGASYSQNIADTIVFHGMLLGIGSSLCFFPSITVLPMWFNKRRSIATGLAVLGSGLGSLVYAIVGQTLFDEIGWRLTLRYSAALSGGLLLVALVLLNRRIPLESKSGLFSDTAILKDRNFQYMLFCGFFFQFAFMIPYVHLDNYAIKLGISTSGAAVATGAFGIGSSVGRLVLSALGDYVIPLKVMRTSVVAVGVTMLLWPACTTLPSIIAFALFYGFFSGGFVASSPVVFADFWGISRLGGMMGYQSLFMVPGALAGAPFAGYLVDSTGSYTDAAIIGGVILIVSGGALFCIDSSKMLNRKTVSKPSSSLTQALPEPAANLLQQKRSSDGSSTIKQEESKNHTIEVAA